MSHYGKLYLVPNFIGDPVAENNFPPANLEIIRSLRVYFAENPKPARQFLKKIFPEIPFDTTLIYQHDKHHENRDTEREFIQHLLDGANAGLLSDSGCPGVADPGSSVIQLAHELGIDVVPLVGPSSILLTLMASGLNGQHFSFVGYIPRQRDERIRELKRMAADAQKNNTTFLFIETPYRAHHVLDDLVSVLPGQMVICAGVDMMSAQQKVISQPVHWWKKNIKSCPLEQKLVVFAIGIQP